VRHPNFYRSSVAEASRRERRRAPSKVVKMQMRLLERLPAVPKPSEKPTRWIHQPSQCLPESYVPRETWARLLNSQICITRGERASISETVWKSTSVYLCFVYSRDISRINPIRHMLLLLLRKREREFSKREEIYEQRTEFRQSNIYFLDGCSLFLSPCDRWGNWNEVELGKNTRHVAFYPPPSFFYYFGNYPLLAYAHGNLPCY